MLKTIEHAIPVSPSQYFKQQQKPLDIMFHLLLKFGIKALRSSGLSIIQHVQNVSALKGIVNITPITSDPSAFALISLILSDVQKVHRTMFFFLSKYML